MKKNFGKIVGIVLAMCLFAAMAMGSGSSEKGESKNSSTKSEGSAAANQTTKEADNLAETTSAATDKPAEVRSYTINNEVLVDNDVCTFTIVKAEVDKFWGFTLDVYCENKTTKPLSFSVDDVIVNGYLSDPLWAKEVAAGKKANDEINFSSTSFEEIGITTADEIIFTLKVRDVEDWMADALLKKTFTIYPTGLTAETVVYPERRTSADEQILVSNDKVLVVLIDTKNDSIWGYTLNCYIENKTDQALMFSWDDVSVNGFMIDPFWAKEVVPHARCYTGISFFESDFKKNKIETVDEIEFSFRIYLSDDWMAEDLLKETMKVKP